MLLATGPILNSPVRSVIVRLDTLQDEIQPIVTAQVYLSAIRGETNNANNASIALVYIVKDQAPKDLGVNVSINYPTSPGTIGNVVTTSHSRGATIVSSGHDEQAGIRTIDITDVGLSTRWRMSLDIANRRVIYNNTPYVVGEYINLPIPYFLSPTLFVNGITRETGSANNASASFTFSAGDEAINQGVMMTVDYGPGTGVVTKSAASRSSTIVFDNQDEQFGSRQVTVYDVGTGGSWSLILNIAEQSVTFKDKRYYPGQVIPLGAFPTSTDNGLIRLTVLNVKSGITSLECDGRTFAPLLPNNVPVSLLLKFDGEEGSQTIKDLSPNEYPVRIEGTGALSTTRRKYGVGSYLGAPESYFIVGSDNNPFAFGTGDFTIEFWYYPTSLTGQHNIINFSNFSETGITLEGGAFRYKAYNVHRISSAPATINAWQHIAIARISGVTRMFLNGVFQGSWNDALNFLNTGAQWRFGQRSNSIVGNLDDICVNKGIGKYITSFTPQEIPIPTSLLIKFDGANGSRTLTDLSPNAYTITNVGTGAISTTRQRYGGSSYLGAANSYFTVGVDNTPFAFEQGNFTIEFWYYPTNIVDRHNIINFSNFTSTGISLLSGSFTYSIGDTVAVQSGIVSSNEWYHVAVSRNANVTKLFLNGILQGSCPDSLNFVAEGPLWRFAGDGSIYSVAGSIDDLCVSKGVSKYNASFIPEQVFSKYSASVKIKEQTYEITNLDGNRNVPYRIAIYDPHVKKYYNLLAKIGFLRASDPPNLIKTLVEHRSVSYKQGARIRVVGENIGAGSVIGNAPPSIVTQPISQAKGLGTNVTFTIVAVGSSPLFYQWYKDGLAILGAVTTSYTVPSVQLTSEGTYSCVVANAFGTTTSNNASLILNLPPTIVTQPVSQIKALGLSASFSIAATGSATLKYQWYKGGSIITGATSSTYTIASVTNSSQTYYTCAVTNSFGSVLSRIATLGTGVAPIITTQPFSRFAPIGSRVPFGVIVQGTAPLSYQWYLNGRPILNGTAYVYYAAEAGSYSCVITNIFGTATSSSATLTTGIPPSITAQPVSQILRTGVTATFNVGVAGTTPLSYQWYRNGQSIPGATSPSYSTTATVGGTFNCTISNNFGAVASNAATLQIGLPPTIIVQPAAQTKLTGTSATFGVGATSQYTIGYQWQKDGTNIPGATSSVYNINSTSSSNAGNYRCVVSNSYGVVVSDNAALVVTAAPSIVTQPLSQSVATGSGITFAVGATGTTPLTYQWTKDGVNVPGANSISYSIPSVTSTHVGAYTCIVSNIYGSARSVIANLTVNTVPSIIRQPGSRILAVGSSVTLSIEAAGSTPLIYQWYKNGGLIQGASSTSYNIPTLGISDSGNFTCIVSNIAGSVTSNPATLTIGYSPTFTTQPITQNIIIGTSADLNVVVAGTAPITLQWYRNGVAITGATADVYRIQSVDPTNAGNYSCVATNIYGVTSSLSVAVNAVGVAPSISTQPLSQDAKLGIPLTLNVTATGTVALRYQWNKDGNDIVGATSNSYTIASVTRNAYGAYKCVVTNDYGTAVSVIASLKSVEAPIIAVHPASQVRPIGQNGKFRVAANGSVPLSYQWYKDNVIIPGATSSSYEAATYSVTRSTFAASMGSVKVYTLIGNNWSQIGQNLIGESTGDTSGYSTSLNAAGDRIAIGAIANNAAVGRVDSGQTRIYQYNLNLNLWEQIGQDINGEGGYDKSGWSVSLNAIGNRVAIGAPYNDGVRKSACGHVRVYELDSQTGQWVQVGQDIDGEATGDLSGYSVSLNAAGNKVIIGAPGNDSTNSSSAGQVRIYSLVGNTWTQIGLDVDGEVRLDRSGHSVSINAEGDRVAVGANFNDGANNKSPNSGHTRIYQWNGNSWAQMGSDIDGEASYDQSGYSISLNGVGNRVAIGAAFNDPTGRASSSAGHTRIYQWNGNTWTQMGSDIDGELLADQSGYSVSLNTTGDRVFIGARFNNGTYAADSGQTRVYQWNGIAWVQVGSDIDGDATGDRSGWSVTSNSAGDKVAVGAPYNDGNRYNIGTYKCTVSNPFGSVTTNNAILAAGILPVFAYQPTVQQYAAIGKTVTFKVVVTVGSTPMLYQWRFNGINIPNANSPAYIKYNLSTLDTGVYTCVVTNPYGSIISSDSTLTVGAAPSIVVQPVAQIVNILTPVDRTFSITATGDATLLYQWRKDGVFIDRAPTISSYTISSGEINSTSAGSYSCVVQNNFGTALSNAATLTVLFPPTITQQPVSQSVNLGAPTNKTFTVLATGDAPLSYQWTKNGAAIVGATTSSYTILSNTISTNSAGSYRCVVTNNNGSTTSNEAVLTVLVPPTITSHPASRTINLGAPGGDVIFTITATGDAPLTYQWTKNGAAIVGATASSYIIPIVNIPTSAGGEYRCVVTNGSGVATSNQAVLVIQPVYYYHELRMVVSMNIDGSDFFYFGRYRNNNSSTCSVVHRNWQAAGSMVINWSHKRGTYIDFSKNPLQTASYSSPALIANGAVNIKYGDVTLPFNVPALAHAGYVAPTSGTGWTLNPDKAMVQLENTYGRPSKQIVQTATTANKYTTIVLVDDDGYGSWSPATFVLTYRWLST